MIPQLGNSFMIKKKEIDNKSNNLKAVGLRSILVHHLPKESNVVVKQSMKLTSSIRTTNSNISSFLKSCFLCNKNLCPHEDIYMYRGDQGYCSIECRQKQIDIDERRELEASTKQILASFRRCHDGGATKTHLLLNDLRRQHNRLPRPRFREVVS